MEVFFRHEREHRVLVVLRGAGPRPAPRRHRPAAHRGARRSPPSRSTPRPSAPPTSIAEVDAQVRRVLADEPKANVVLFRGFDTHRELPGFDSASGCAPRPSPSTRCTAASPGCSAWTCSGVPPISPSSSTILRDAWDDYDYFFLHHKYTDSAGEDGDRARKIQAIETARRGRARAARPVPRRDRGERRPLHAVADGRALVAPGAHAAVERALRARRRRAVRREWCRQGALGLRPTKDLMAFMLANAGRLAKYGA